MFYSVSCWSKCVLKALDYVAIKNCKKTSLFLSLPAYKTLTDYWEKCKLSLNGSHISVGMQHCRDDHNILCRICFKITACGYLDGINTAVWYPLFTRVHKLPLRSPLNTDLTLAKITTLYQSNQMIANGRTYMFVLGLKRMANFAIRISWTQSFRISWTQSFRISYG